MKPNEAKSEFQIHSLKWLLEMEMIDDPRVLNMIKFNVFAKVRRVVATEFLILLPPKREMLILVETTWLGRLFQTKLLTEVELVVKAILPQFEVKVTLDPLEFQAAHERVLKYLKENDDRSTLTR